ncbi:hypothetical protein ADUPG1_008819, partial [Aduncisulcus paluster]
MPKMDISEYSDSSAVDPLSSLGSTVLSFPLFSSTSNESSLTFPSLSASHSSYSKNNYSTDVQSCIEEVSVGFNASFTPRYSRAFFGQQLPSIHNHRHLGGRISSLVSSQPISRRRSEGSWDHTSQFSRNS